MKAMLCIIGAATLFLTSGCTTYDQGGYYGTAEYETGEYRSYPDYPPPSHHYERHGYTDQYGIYHPYPARRYPESQGQIHPYSWDRRY